MYTRHGVRGDSYGVSYANLGSLKKKIKTDLALALGLWKSGNHDARVLATMIAPPAEMTPAILNVWARDLDNYVMTDAVAKLAAGTPEAVALAEKWIEAKSEWIASAGWTMMAALAATDIPDAYLEPLLGRIRETIHTAKNRVRHAMNNTVIAIGARGGTMMKLAIETARVIGTVNVNHGETGCVTPDAEAYITKIMQRKAGAAEKKSPRAKA